MTSVRCAACSFVTDIHVLERTPTMDRCQHCGSESPPRGVVMGEERKWPASWKQNQAPVVVNPGPQPVVEPAVEVPAVASPPVAELAPGVTPAPEPTVELPAIPLNPHPIATTRRKR